MRQLAFAALLASTALGATAASAAVTTYSSRASFLSSVTGAVTSDFEGKTSTSLYAGASGVTGAGYTITATDNYLFYNDATYTNYYYNWNSGDSLTTKQFATITINFTTAVTAFGVDLATFFQGTTPCCEASTSYGYNVAVGTAQGGYNVTTLQRPNLAFFGATSDTAFSSFTLTSGNYFMLMDNLTLAVAPAAAAVPEPATWAMMIAGFGIVGLGLRRRRQTLASYA